MFDDADKNIIASLRHEACEGHCEDCGDCFTVPTEDEFCENCHDAAEKGRLPVVGGESW